MTVSPPAPSVSFEDLDSALAALREQGLRISTARRLVLKALFAASAPVSAERIAGELERSGSSLELASIYRSLEAFERCGIARHVHLGHSPGLYALIGSGEREYLYCESCGCAVALEPAQFDDVRSAIRERFGYEARFGHFPIVGLCERCALATANDLQ